MPAATHTAIRGARLHNLQGVDCRIPLRAITVVTGVSGSGKSTLAFDTLYAEGQRRFVECLSAYARQFMERLERPQVEEIGCIQPPIALKQRVSIKNARSTVGTITELTDLLRLLFVHAGEARCAACGGPVRDTTAETASATLLRWPAGTSLAIVAPLPAPGASDLLRLRRDGFARLLWAGHIVDIESLIAGTVKTDPSPPRADIRRASPDSGVVIDRFVAGQTRRGRLTEAIKSAWALGQGVAVALALEPGAPSRLAAGAPVSPGPLTLREGFACTECGTAGVAPTPALFSWNSPLGACPECHGFGRIITIDAQKVVPDPRKNLKNHAIVPLSVPSARGWYRWMLRAARARGLPVDVPFGRLPPEQQRWALNGAEDFPGVQGFFEHLDRKRYKMHVRIFVARFRGYTPCPRCGGARLRPEALAFTIGGSTLHELHARPIEELPAFFASLTLPAAVRRKVRPILESIAARLRSLIDLGTGYLTLGRSGRTLSGGETQRTRIAAALGTALTDTLFVLDEPTVGLHATDTAAMIAVLRRLARGGNTVVVVEHDAQVAAQADHLIVLGPGGGRDGGRLLYEGSPGDFLRANPDYFCGAPPLAAGPRAPHPGMPRAHARGRGPAARARRLAHPWSAEEVSRWLESRDVSRANRAPMPPLAPRLRLTGASENNLRITALEIPLGGVAVISGVSGSGKSTLLDQVIYRNWLRLHGRPAEGAGRAERIEGLEAFPAAHLVGQEPLGRSTRSNPISFVQAYAEIRELLAQTPSARKRKLAAGAFSFNVPGGRCEACRGLGTQMLEMYFLPDVEVVCEACRGQRFRPEILEVRWHGRNIREILDLTVDEATNFFGDEPRVVARLTPLREVGLGYIVLGQSTASLSTGEAQRLRLGALLAQTRAGVRSLFLFDEPTTGLHARDVAGLLSALRALAARGHSVIAVEHQLDFVLAADWVVDLGPGPGAAGGTVVYAGTARGLLQHPTSLTARALRDHAVGIGLWSEDSG